LLDALRTCLQIAGGLTEATRRRTSEAARQLLDQAGVDLDELQRKVSDRIPPEVQTLADELIATGRANRDLLAGLIKEEIDKAMARVGRLADDVTKVGVILEALERRVRSLEDAKPAPTGGGQMAPTRERIPFADEGGPAAPAEGAAPEAAAAVLLPGPARKAAVKKAAPAKKVPAKKVPAKKAAVKKAAPAKKVPATKTAVKKTAAKQGAAKKGTAKSAVAKKTAPANPVRGEGETHDE
jgi:hypothetical protein